MRHWGKWRSCTTSAEDQRDAHPQRRRDTDKGNGRQDQDAQEHTSNVNDRDRQPHGQREQEQEYATVAAQQVQANEGDELNAEDDAMQTQTVRRNEAEHRMREEDNWIRDDQRKIEQRESDERSKTDDRDKGTLSESEHAKDTVHKQTCADVCNMRVDSFVRNPSCPTNCPCLEDAEGYEQFPLHFQTTDTWIAIAEEGNKNIEHRNVSNKGYLGQLFHQSTARVLNRQNADHCRPRKYRLLVMQHRGRGANFCMHDSAAPLFQYASRTSPLAINGADFNPSILDHQFYVPHYGISFGRCISRWGISRYGEDRFGMPPLSKTKSLINIYIYIYIYIYKYIHLLYVYIIYIYNIYI